MLSRPFFALAAAATLVVGLAACSSTPAPVESTAAPDAAGAVDVCATVSGDASGAVKVSGDADAAPTVTFDAGITASTTERTVLTEGSGAELPAGGSAEVKYAIYNGASGKLIEASGYEAGQQPAVFAADATQVIPGVAKAIGCLNEGSRVVAVIPPADAFGEAGNDQIGLTATDSIVAVIDIVSVVPQRADGADQPAEAGFPTVTLADDGEPTIDVTGVAAPTELEVAVLKKGDGPEVPADAQVSVQYKGVLLSDGTEFDSSWSRGAIAQFGLSGTVPGFAQAIQGQTVGSQIIAVIPAAQAYGDKATGSIPANSDLVFVIDILATS